MDTRIGGAFLGSVPEASSVASHRRHRPSRPRRRRHRTRKSVKNRHGRWVTLPRPRPVQLAPAPLATISVKDREKTREMATQASGHLKPASLVSVATQTESQQVNWQEQAEQVQQKYEQLQAQARDRACVLVNWQEQAEQAQRKYEQLQAENTAQARHWQQQAEQAQQKYEQLQAENTAQAQHIDALQRECSSAGAPEMGTAEKPKPHSKLGKKQRQARKKQHAQAQPAGEAQRQADQMAAQVALRVAHREVDQRYEMPEEPSIFLAGSAIYFA